MCVTGNRFIVIRIAVGVTVCGLLSCWTATALAQPAPEHPAWLPAAAVYDVPFFEGAQYDPAVPTPAQILGYEVGIRLATHAELERCLRAWQTSGRMTLHEYARSHEQRALYYAVITSEHNHARLDDIRAAIGKLADPRKLADDAEAQRIIATTPAVAWLAYSIHGDELSSTDAALAVMYHLLAGTDDDVRQLLEETVVLVDPLMNPDGRDRFIRQISEFGGYVPSLDVADMQHNGRWPWGRGNHYLFDLNRDWILGVHPETRGRQRAIVQWRPQLLVDSHEMGPHGTYLFNPPREPFNPHLSPLVRKWWGPFADDQARAFDRYGWSYYTREWLEFWYPGYSDSWAAYYGAIGILYEQARTGGSPIRQRSGAILTYREAVHHHAVSSLANLKTLHANRREILADFLEQSRAALAGPDEVFLLAPGDNLTRTRAFLENLHNQGIEIGVADAAFSATHVTDILRNTEEQRTFAAGTYVIPQRQPAGPLVGAMLGFDPRMEDEFLQSERKELETKRESRVYDITGWSVPMAYALDAYWCAGPVDVQTRPYASPPAAVGSVPTADKPYAYVIDGADDASFRALAYLLQADVVVRVAEREFRAAGRTFLPGSLLIRRHENEADLADRLRQAGQATGVTVYAATTARSPDETPDLGGGRFTLLQRPRVALLGDYPTSPGSFGNIWHLFDREVGLAVSLHSAGSRRLDLRRYNVIILSPAWGSAYGTMLDSLRTWVRSGGTLIAVGNAAATLADEASELSAVRRRRDVLDKLDEYAYAVALERAAGKVPVNTDNVWDTAQETPPASMPAKPAKPDVKAETLDEWRRIFEPQGVIVRGELNTEHWLTFGCPAQMPLFAAGDNVLMSRRPVETPVRLAPAEHLRLSGLLWPEAVARMGDSAYATVERVGRGQVILFAHDPNFRGYWHGSRRLLINAVLLGPGCGTSQPAP